MDTEAECLGCRGKLQSAIVELARERSRRAEEALTDPLTGLMNRRGLDEFLQDEKQRHLRLHEPTSALVLDLDDFKGINDHYGHTTGDAVLKIVADKIKDTVRETDAVARIGGDEFVVVLVGARKQEAIVVAEKVRLAIASANLPISNGRQQVTASSGMAQGPFSSTDELLSATRMALSGSKRDGKNMVSGLGDHEYEPIAAQVLQNTNMLWAVAQPIVHTDTRLCGGYEMLIRVKNGVFHTPEELFRSAVETNTLVAVDLACLRAACATASSLPVKHVNFNLFPSTLNSTSSEYLLEILHAAGNRDVGIELSEQQFIGDPNQIIHKVQELKRAGVTIALDDVGFGRSSLEALIVLEPDIIKIDREYVRECDKDPGTRRCLDRLIKIAKQLGAQVVCEGVETEEEYEIIRQLGGEYCQGYLFGKPS